MITEQASSRPLSVTAALVLIIAGYVAIAVLVLGRQVADAWHAGSPGLPGLLMLAVALLVWALLGVFMIGALARRRRWAWWVWFLLFALELPALLLGLQHSFAQGMSSATVAVLMTVFAAAIVVLLLLPASRRWCGVGAGQPGP